MSTFQTLSWVKERQILRLLDQRQLPNEEIFIECETLAQVADAIKTLTVRGAPAIGVAAAYGVIVGLKELITRNQSPSQNDFAAIITELARTRPTAVNLFWALTRMKNSGGEALRRGLNGTDLCAHLLQEADLIFVEDRRCHHRLGKFGAALIPNRARILTHCNAGALACADYGTALGVIRAAHSAGKRIEVFADETRPLLQGARLTAWELLKDKIPVTLICDNMAAHCMAKGMIDLVIVGADRIAANGDCANKIGTYGVAVLCHHHDLPFYVDVENHTQTF